MNEERDESRSIHATIWPPVRDGAISLFVGAIIIFLVYTIAGGNSLVLMFFIVLCAAAVQPAQRYFMRDRLTVTFWPEKIRGPGRSWMEPEELLLRDLDWELCELSRKYLHIEDKTGGVIQIPLSWYGAAEAERIREIWRGYLDRARIAGVIVDRPFVRLLVRALSVGVTAFVLWQWYRVVGGLDAILRLFQVQ